MSFGDDVSTDWQELKPLDAAARRRFTKIRNAFLVCVTLVASTILVKYFAGVRWLTAVYIVIQTMTTVGYGDFTVGPDRPSEQMTRLVLAFLSICWLIIAAYALSEASQVLVYRRAEYVRSKFRKMQVKQFRVGSEEEAKAKFGVMNKLITSFMFWAAGIAAGTLFFRFFENCTCSYGYSRNLAIEAGQMDGSRCKESTWFGEQVDYDTCLDAGGFDKTFIDAFYLAVITSTTIGYGDETPDSLLGRAFSCFFMIYSVGASALFVEAIAETLFNRKMENDQDRALMRQQYGHLDKAMDRREFLSYVLVKNKMVEKDIVDDIDGIFTDMDAEKEGFVTRKQFKEYMQRNTLKAATYDRVPTMSEHIAGS